MTILALAMVPIYGALSGGLRAEVRAEDTIGAVLAARSIIEEVGTARPLAPGRDDLALDDGSVATILIEQVEPVPSLGGTAGTLSAYAVTVAVSVDNRPVVSLSTIKLPSAQ